MTLSFSTEINNKPNDFIEKIWECLLKNGLSTISEYQNRRMAFNDRFESDWTVPNNNKKFAPKLHTIRRDEHTRWKAGNIIHPVINNRTPERFQFGPPFPCVSTQYFEILWEDGEPTVYIGDNEEDWAPFYFDTVDEESDGGRVIYGEEQMLELAINDGFESIKDFFAYFNTNFEGKIIHWTDKRYNKPA